MDVVIICLLFGMKSQHIKMLWDSKLHQIEIKIDRKNLLTLVSKNRLLSFSEIPVIQNSISAARSNMNTILVKSSFIALYITIFKWDNQSIELTKEVCPFKVSVHLPLLVSQIFTKVSGEQETSLLPVLSYIRDQTPFSWPVKVDRHLYVGASQILIVWSWDAVENSFSEVGLMQRASTELSWAIKSD